MDEIILAFENWCSVNYLIFEWQSLNQFIISGFEGKFLLIEPKDDKLLDEDCCLSLYEEELELVEGKKVDYLAFEFGGRFYYTKPKEFKNKFNQIGYEAHFDDLKFLGDNNCEIDNVIHFVNLGIHSEYELLNGSQKAEDWVKKSVFLKHKSIALVDRNTMAGTLAFQTYCKKTNVKPVMGMTASVAYDYEEANTVQTTYDLKLYVVNEEGWQNLFQINKAINVDYDKFIPEEVLLNYSKGLIAVLPPLSVVSALESTKDVLRVVSKYKQHFDALYYQIDSVEYYSDEFDIKCLNQIKTYLDKYRKFVPPVLINDSYYIDQEMYQVKEYLNKIDRKAYEYSEDQYFKTLDDTNERLSVLFEDKDYYFDLLVEMCQNTINIAEACNYEINTGEHKLPKYEFVEEGKTNEDFFFELLEKGIAKKIDGKVEDAQIYLERLQKECAVIVGAGFVDYFLILWDIIDWCKENDIGVGPGRGSVGGCIIAYLLDIITIDPVKFGLLFERFLNEARVSGERAKAADSLPDVDVDFESQYRSVVKAYISERFGNYYTCSIGAYTRLKLKAGIKDFGLAKGLSFEYRNFITKDIEQELEYTWRDLIVYALRSKDKKDNRAEGAGLYEFIQKYPDIAHCIKFTLNQARSASIHASALIIVPKKDKAGNDVNIFNWLPIRRMGDLFVSEWEGKYCERAGFLKEDILSLDQLDKFQMIKKLIKANYDTDIVLEDIPLDDVKTYKLFHKGLNEDVFQFGSAGLKNYSLKAKPDNIEDLTAMNALFRPGPMESNAHMDFVLLKNGKKKVEYDFGLKEVTEKTQGLYIYQETIMQAVMVLGGFSAVESDVLRTQIKKFDQVAMRKGEQQFIDGAVKRGCKPDEAKKIWNKLVAFSKYGFNKSHSCDYAHMSYWSQWLKANYPLEFWTASLQMAKDKHVPKRISELKKLKQGLQISPPDINKSAISFACDPETNTIFWSLAKIEGNGDAIVKAILQEREAGGRFISYDDFVLRVPKKVINKTVVAKLIVSGCFDIVEGLTKPIERQKLLVNHYLRLKEQTPDIYTSDIAKKNYYWIMLQKTSTGFGDVDYNTVLMNNPNKVLGKKLAGLYVDGERFDKCKDYTEVCVAGTCIYANEKTSPKAGRFLTMNIISNNDLIIMIAWADAYDKYYDFLSTCLNKTIAISGKAKFDDWRGQTILYINVDSKMLEL